MRFSCSGHTFPPEIHSGLFMSEMFFLCSSHFWEACNLLSAHGGIIVDFGFQIWGGEIQFLTYSPVTFCYPHMPRNTYNITDYTSNSRGSIPQRPWVLSQLWASPTPSLLVINSDRHRKREAPSKGGRWKDAMKWQTVMCREPWRFDPSLLIAYQLFSPIILSSCSNNSLWLTFCVGRHLKLGIMQEKLLVM